MTPISLIVQVLSRLQDKTQNKNIKILLALCYCTVRSRCPNISTWWAAKTNEREGATIYDSGPLYWVEETQCIVSHWHLPPLLLPHNTSGGGGPGRYDGAPFAPLRKNVCLLFHHSPGPQENKPISCHCDRIKMEPSYFSNTMQP